MNTTTNNTAYYPDPYSQFNIKKFLSHIRSKWYWIVASLFIALLGAWGYSNYISPEYSIHSSLIINEYESGIKRLSLSQNQNNSREVNVMGQDHTGRLRSHFIGLTTLERLGWNTIFYEQTPLYGKDLYKREPYMVTLIPNKSNITEIPIYVKSLTDKEYLIEVDAKDDFHRDIKVIQKGRFGEPFENRYFNFILTSSNSGFATTSPIYFTINNLSKTALDFQKKLKVMTNEKKPDMMELIFSCNNKERGVDYLNSLEQTYIEYGLEEKNRVAENTMNFIDNQLKNVTDSLAYSERKVTNFRTRTQSIDLNQAGGLVMQKQETLESEKAILESRLTYLYSLYNNIHDSKSMRQVVVPSVYGITDQTLNTLVAKLSDLYSRREVLSFSVKDKAPSLILLDNEIKLTNSMLEGNISTLLTTTKAELGNLNRRVGGFSNQLSLLPQTEQELSSLKRSFDLNNELYTYLLKMRAESAITYASNQPDVKILDAAHLETAEQTRPLTLINYLTAIILGLFFPITIILIYFSLNKTIQSQEEIRVITSLPISGMIIHNKQKNELAVVDNPRSAIAESFRSLRTNLKYILNGEAHKIIAIQSSVSGEGKSFISANLATILAANNLNVLVIGADMRKSKLEKILGSSNKKGLSTYLSNQDNFDHIVENTAVKNLSFIPSGPLPPNPAELLENGNFEKLLLEAKSRFDYILIDCPPISLVTDGLIIGRQVDSNLLIVRFRHSHIEHLKIFNELHNNKSIPLLSLVLNDAKEENMDNGSYYSRKNKAYYHE